MKLNKVQGYDLIGDIHGHADELHDLLKHLGYSFIDGCYRHPERKVIFLGDFIDRGPKQREVLITAISMVKQGAALSVMGNHEFNALAYHTEHPKQSGVWLRPHSNKNTQQHLAFLQEYLDKGMEEELKDALNFFMSLPLWIELDGLRVVHACWEPHYIKGLAPRLGPNNTLTTDLLVEASMKDTPAYHAVEALLKGVETELPNDTHFLDKDGHKRTAARTRWWHNDDTQMGEIALPPGVLDSETAKIEISANELVGYPEGEKPVFLGHYWLKGHPAKLADNVACLDYSVAKNGKLVAYRWNGEKNINNENFHFK